MRRLTVLSVAFPFATAGRDAVGGAEQILNCLDEALVAAGHRSIVVAAEGSNVRGTLVPTPLPPGRITDAVRCTVHARHLANICTAIDRFTPDLIHMHGIDFHCYLPPAGIPLLVTLHLPPAWYPQEIWHIKRPDTHLHCVSRTQQRQCPPGVKLLQPIPNGVSIEQLHYHCTKRHYAIALGRICPEKNFHVAIDAAKAADTALLIGGQTFPYETHESYFHSQIEPRLNGQIRFLGPLAFERKRRLLSGAQCLISASLAAETSSLVAMESLACGTPVVAIPSGALPEIVDDGVTGFLVADEREMAAAIGRCRDIDPEACREAARKRFSLATMVDRYLEVYRGLTQERLTIAEPVGNAEVITTPAELQQLESEWHRLWLDDEHATVFQSPAWLLPWWKHIGQGELLTSIVRAGTGRRLVGLLPLYIYTQSSGSRDLFPLGIATSDYLDQVAAPGYEASVLTISLAAVLAQSSKWDVLDLQQLRESSPLLQMEAPAGLSDTRMQSEACPVLELPDRMEELPGVLPWNVLHNLTYYRSRAQRLGFQIDAVNERNVDEAYEALLDLHRARWSQRQEAGVLSDLGVQRAHRETIPALLRDECLRMFVLRVGGRIAAVFYGLCDPPGHERRSVYYYLSGFDPQYKTLSPGTLLIGHAIEQAVREGFTYFDFLRGQEKYKYLWGAVDRPTYRRLLRHARATVPAASAQEALR